MKEAEGQGRAAETLSLGLGRRLSRQRQQERLQGFGGRGPSTVKEKCGKKALERGRIGETLAWEQGTQGTHRGLQK